MKILYIFKKNICMKLSIINLHSFIDVITNSSTELFISESDDPINMIELILLEIIKNYNKKYNTTLTLDIFERPIKLSYEDYLIWKGSEERNENELYETLESWFINDDEDSKKEYRKNNIKHRIWMDIDNSLNDIYVNLCLGKDIYSDECIELVDDIYNYVENGDINKPNWWDEPYLDYQYQIRVRDLDGKIFIFSSDDNSVPYVMWDEINIKLNATNYHLG